MNILPKSITLNKNEGYLQIEWQDERICQYPLSHLREACPCVMGMKYAPDNILSLKPARSYSITDIQAIGNYAIQPTWDDGHSTGIYTWEYLYHLCPVENLNTED
jgi:DUF971 family protein